MDRFARNNSLPVSVEKRADGTPVITGYAAVFYRDSDPDSEYEIFPGFVEQISRSAFSRAIEERDDARALFNHDSKLILGRVSAGTLRLSVNDRGLLYEIDPPETQYARDCMTSISRGDISGSSFAFTARKEHMRAEESRDVRVLEDVNLFDVGPVTYPAYGSTSAHMRSDSPDYKLHAEWQQWRAVREKRSEVVRQRLTELKRHGNH